jgi:hypothetical protein
MKTLIIKIVVVIVAAILVSKFLAPILIGLYPPFGLIILVLLYMALVFFLISGRVF